MSPTITRLFAISVCSLMLSGCVAGAVVGAGAAVIGTTAKVTGAVVGAGIDAVHTSDEELRERREKEEKRCERLRRRGKEC